MQLMHNKQGCVCRCMYVRESAAARGFKQWGLEGRDQNDEKGYCLHSELTKLWIHNKKKPRGKYRMMQGCYFINT